MAARSTEFDHLRLSREADLAGQAFAFEDTSDPSSQRAGSSAWLWWAAAFAALAGLVALRFV